MNGRQRSLTATAARFSALALATAAAGGCGGGTGPVDATNVPYGQTTFVVVLNPAVNAINTLAVPTPDTARVGVTITVPQQGPSDVTDTTGVAALSPVLAGTRTLAFRRDSVESPTRVSIAAQALVPIESRELREVAVALTPDAAEVMTTIQYAFGGRVVEVTPRMPIGEVNKYLAESNVIVFLRGGTYTGNLTFSGSNVTLYGEGRRGGAVTIDGSVTVGGSGNRIRGARITGSLSVPANNFGMSLSRVDGAFQLNGSGAKLLQNVFCGTVTSPTSNVTALGNAGMAPLAKPAYCTTS